MLATQNAYDADHPITKYNVEIKSHFHELQVNVPELEIKYVKDRNTVSLASRRQVDMSFDSICYSRTSSTIPSLVISSAEE